VWRASSRSPEAARPPDWARGVSSARDIEEQARARVREVDPEADLTAMAVVFNLIRASDRVVQDLETVHRPMGWSWAGFRVLFWVWLLGPLEPREIASFASASRASVSSVLNTLERDGFVVRVRRSNDRRLVTVELTDSGRELIGRAFKAHNEREQEWASVFSSDERATLVGLLRRLVAYTPSSAGTDVDPPGL
jgi:DNA-binding MarR family transcriptional regulator